MNKKTIQVNWICLLLLRAHFILLVLSFSLFLYFIILINIILIDKTGKEIATIPGIVAPVKAGGIQQLNAGITEDYANAYDFKVEKR